MKDTNDVTMLDGSGLGLQAMAARAEKRGKAAWDKGERTFAQELSDLAEALRFASMRAHIIHQEE